jgi:hypothetical protein
MPDMNGHRASDDKRAGVGLQTPPLPLRYLCALAKRAATKLRLSAVRPLQKSIRYWEIALASTEAFGPQTGGVFFAFIAVGAERHHLSEDPFRGTDGSLRSSAASAVR